MVSCYNHLHNIGHVLVIICVYDSQFSWWPPDDTQGVLGDDVKTVTDDGLNWQARVQIPSPKVQVPASTKGGCSYTYRLWASTNPLTPNFYWTWMFQVHITRSQTWNMNYMYVHKPQGLAFIDSKSCLNNYPIHIKCKRLVLWWWDIYAKHKS